MNDFLTAQVFHALSNLETHPNKSLSGHSLGGGGGRGARGKIRIMFNIMFVPRMCKALPYKNETMAPIHVATPTVQTESYLNMRLYLASRVSTLPLYQE